MRKGFEYNTQSKLQTKYTSQDPLVALWLGYTQQEILDMKEAL